LIKRNIRQGDVDWCVVFTIRDSGAGNWGGGELLPDLSVTSGKNLSLSGGVADNLTLPNDAEFHPTGDGSADLGAIQVALRVVKICPRGGDIDMRRFELGVDSRHERRWHKGTGLSCVTL
jgi:hypothetical protein